jgi:integrase/recombinase XerC
MSLAAFVNYLSLEKNFSDHTLGAYKSDISSFKAFCRDEFDSDHIIDIDYSAIRSWIVVLVNSGISNRSINRKVASLKAYYKFLHQLGRIDINPLSGHKALKTSKRVEVPFSENEMEIVLKQIPFEKDFEGVRDKLMIELLYTTGIRRAELINLKVTDVDLKGNLMKVLGKRNKERLVPLLQSTIAIFVDYFEERNGLNNLENNQYVFLSKTGSKIYSTLVYRVINKYLSKVSSKVKKSPHILRHTFATHMLNNGADLNSVKELLGHSSLASTQVYTHNSIAELKKVHFTSHPRSKK